MSRSRHGLRIYVTSIAMLAGLGVWWVLTRSLLTPWFDWALFAILSASFNFFPIRIDADTDVVFLLPLTVAAVIVGGPMVGVTATAVGVAAAQVFLKKSWAKGIFNTSLLTIEATAAAAVFVLSGHSPGEPVSLPLATVVLVMIAVGELTSVVIFGGLLQQLAGEGYWKSLLAVGSTPLRQAPIEAFVAIIFLSVQQSIGRPGMAIMAMLLVLVRFGFQAYYDLRKAFEEVQSMLISILDARDAYTAGHSARVSDTAVKIAKQLGLPPREVENIRRAGLLHDIGKVNVPDNVLKKPGRLSDEEVLLMNQHPVDGARFVEGVSSLKHLARIIRYHHERYDGNGYPDGLSGEDIPLGARVLLVADAFDAMTTDRPYRKALPKTEALGRIITNAGSQFDARVALAALHVLGACVGN